MTGNRAMLLVLSVLLAGCARPGQPITGPAARITAEAFAQHVRFLAQPELGGRMAATEGNRAAADYIARQFADAGLSPGGPDGSFFQPFTNDLLLAPEPRCDLRFATSTTQPAALIGRPGVDFAPSAQGKLGAFSAPLVFAGYGLHNRLRNYNDYQSLSARGAVVMLLAGEPHGATGQSRWAIAGEQTRLADLGYKLRLARDQGAVAALVITPAALMPHDTIDDVLGDCSGAIPAVRITRAFADRLLASAGAEDTIASLVDRLHRTRQPASFAVGGLVSGVVALAAGRCRNVVGVLPPNGADNGRTLLVGAHYDHLPATGQKARDDGPGVRCGADDNASGVAAMLLVARALADTPARRGACVFVAFDSEEMQFAGSRYYVRHPTTDLACVDAMVNIDQVGLISRRGVLVLGSTLDPRLGRAVQQARVRSDLKVIPLPVTSARRWSDQAAFVRAGVPTLFLWGQSTDARHTRRDTADRVRAQNGAAAGRLVYDIVRDLSGAEGAGPRSQEAGVCTQPQDGA